MATDQVIFELSYRLDVAKALARYRRVRPSEDEPALGCTKATTKDVIEGIEVVTPLGIGDEHAAHDSEEFFERGEFAAVDLVDRLWQQRVSHTRRWKAGRPPGRRSRPVVL